MKLKEVTRVREQGTRVTMPDQLPNPSEARISALRGIISECQYAKIDGIMVDLFSASAIISVHDKINPINQAKIT